MVVAEIWSNPLITMLVVTCMWRKCSVVVSRDCPNFWVPPIMSGMGKVTDFKFGGYIYRANPNNSPFTL